MATVTPRARAHESLSAFAFAASTIAGDEVTIPKQGDLIIEFHNTSAGTVTVNIVPVVADVNDPQSGKSTKPTISLALATTLHAMVHLPRHTLDEYSNINDRVPITYGSGNVGLLIRALATE